MPDFTDVNDLALIARDQTLIAGQTHPTSYSAQGIMWGVVFGIALYWITINLIPTIFHIIALKVRRQRRFTRFKKRCARARLQNKSDRPDAA